MTHARIAIVEPDDQLLSLCLEALAQAGHHALGIPSEELALAALPRLRLDLVLVSLSEEGVARVRAALGAGGRGPAVLGTGPEPCPPTRASLVGLVERALADASARGVPTEPAIDVHGFEAWRPAA